MADTKIVNGKTYRLIYCPYIHRNGKVIYPTKSKYFKFWVEVI